MAKHHRYPKTRKRRNCENSMTQRLLKQIGKDTIHEIWLANGHRKTAKILTEMMGELVSPMVLQYMAARLFFWQRIVTDRTLPMYRGVLSGKTDAKIFKTIIFA